MFEIGVVVAVIVGISQVIKNSTPINTKYIPLVNLALGVLFGAIFLTEDLKSNIFVGIVMGLTASGLFDQTKIMKKK